MISAFGVEHGEISKARRKRLTAAQKATQGTPATAGPTLGQRTKGKLHRMGEADISLKGVGGSLGRGFEHVGGFMRKRPGLVGTAAVGGGAVAGYKYLSNREPNRKRVVT